VTEPLARFIVLSALHCETQKYGGL